jgi:dTDP-4-amino-4,6-dideoxygalactose transaminase
MAITNDKKLADMMRSLRSHGISNNQNEMLPTPSDEIWNYQQHLLGFNYRMTELQAALGLSQLTKLDIFVAKRHELAKNYDAANWNTSIVKPWQLSETYSSFHLYIIRVNKESPKVTQQKVYKELNNAGINAKLHYIPVYRQPFFTKMGFAKGYCPKSEDFFKEAISIPLYVNLTNKEQSFIIQKIDKTIQKKL